MANTDSTRRAGITATGVIRVTPLGGPTVVLDITGARLLSDPTFDPPGTYPVGERQLVKTEPSAWPPEQVSAVSAVLLSHDQHPDNLDHAGREFLRAAPRVWTTTAGAERLGAPAEGLAPWTRVALPLPDGGELEITALPAQHGPDGTEHLTGPVIGFWLAAGGRTLYLSGDNASLDVIQEIRDRCGRPDVAILHAGGAKTPLLGDAYLTLSSAQAARAVHILGEPRTLVVHTDGWAHFTDPGRTVPAAFRAAGLADALVATDPGVGVELP